MTIIVLSLLAIWRRIEVSTFLFTQLTILCLIIYIVLLLISNKLGKVLRRQELVSVLIAFTVASSLTLNIDRSRSFSTLKWVHELQSNGAVSLIELKVYKDLSPEDFRAVQQRVEEQIQLGSIIEKREGVVLSRRGEIIIWIADRIARFCNLTGFNKM